MIRYLPNYLSQILFDSRSKVRGAYLEQQPRALRWKARGRNTWFRGRLGKIYKKAGQFLQRDNDLKNLRWRLIAVPW
jgi:hypothetical protein